MNERDPRSRDLTEPPRLDQKRFELEWIVPLALFGPPVIAAWSGMYGPRQA